MWPLATSTKYDLLLIGHIACMQSIDVAHSYRCSAVCVCHVQECYENG